MASTGESGASAWRRGRAPELLLLSVASLAVGRIAVPSAWLPLGLSVAGAFVTLPYGLFAVAAASLAGMTTGGSPGPAIFAPLLLAPLAMVVRWPRRLPADVAGAAAAGALALLVALLPPFDPLHLIWPGFTAVSALALRLLWRDAARPAADRRRLGTGALAVLCILGAQGIAPFGEPLPVIAGALACLGTARADRGAAAFAVLLGMSIVGTGVAGPAVGLGLAAGTALAAWARRLGPFHAWLAFVTGFLLPQAGVAAPASLERSIGLGLALLGTLLVPERLYARFAAWLSPVPPAEPRATVPERLTQALHQVDGLVRRIAQRPSPQSEQADFARLLGGVRQRICTGCAHEHTCWDAGFYQTYTGVRELLLESDARPVRGRDLPAELRRRCPRPEDVATAIALAGDQHRAEVNMRRLIASERTLTVDTLRGVRQMLDHALSDPQPGQAPRLSFSSGLARVAKARESVSGDSYIVRELPDGRLLVGLSDGMGVGPPAAEESASALDMVEALLCCGMEPALALRAANAARQGGGGERFATMDLLIADLAVGEATSLKIGAPESYVCRGEEVLVLHGDALPLGILPDAQASVRVMPLRQGDLVVLVSDGVLEGVGGPRGNWLEALLRALPHGDPQYVAEAVLDAALGRRRRNPRDDVTVLVTGFHAAEAEPEIRAWVRRRRDTELGIVGGRTGKNATRRGRRLRG